MLCLLLFSFIVFVQVEQDMLEDISIWEKENSREFLMEGVCFKEFVKRQWQDYSAQKEAEKQQRVRLDFLYHVLCINIVFQ